ncbi:MAG TPA: hypothetical protein VLA00_11270 [Xanthobacteraceae bacterium]|nr:hypothetical protein [Xanthobacteraceae bacterium]
MTAAASIARSFSDRLADFLDRIECRRIDDAQELERVFRLRYDAYVREGAIPIGFSRRFADAYDEAPNVSILGVYIDGALASSIRVHVASPDCPDAPGMGVFQDILQPELARGRTITDPTRFVADQALARRHPELPYATTRLAFLAAEYFSADIALATVRAEHQAFYRRTFGFAPLCPPRHYPSLTKPISLMAIERPSFSTGVMLRYPFLRSTAQERALLFGAAVAPVPTIAAPPLEAPDLEPQAFAIQAGQPMRAAA